MHGFPGIDALKPRFGYEVCHVVLVTIAVPELHTYTSYVQGLDTFVDRFEDVCVGDWLLLLRPKPSPSPEIDLAGHSHDERSTIGFDQDAMKFLPWAWVVRNQRMLVCETNMTVFDSHRRSHCR